MPTTAPYGAWKSPIGADLITAKSILISEIFVDPVNEELFHSEGRPSEGGRNVIIQSKENKELINADYNARTQVHEYGGAACLAYGGRVYFSDMKTKRVHVIDASGSPVPVTPENPALRYADMAANPSQPQILVAVQEDHTKPAPHDVVNTLVTIDTQTHTVTPLTQGADFYSSPRFSPDGRHVAWLQWTHPDMPWEGSELVVAEVAMVDAKLEVKNQRVVDGKKDAVSANEPLWVNDDVLVYLCDITRFYNPTVYSLASGISKPILSSPIADDFSEPAWIMGMSMMAYLSENTLIVAPIHEGFAKLALLDLKSSAIHYIENEFVSISFLRRLNATTAVMSARKNDQSPALVQVEFSADNLYGHPPKFTIVKETSTLSSTLPPGFIAGSDALTLNNGNLHVLLTLPKSADYIAPENEKPPAVVNIHGGPTGRVEPGLLWMAQYFTSRGWAWVDVNYSGSSGYGREYRERLRGKWGVAEVADAALAVKELGARGLIDPARATIRGGSAGGFTVLMTLCTPETASVFAAGTSSYGVSDLTLLAGDTHKFESQYLFKLVGGTPEEVPEIYAARSAVKHADQIRSPLLILQGSEDAVVPPNQAKAIVEQIKANNGQVEYVLFEGEGHGWRKAENVKKALETECSFYERVLLNSKLT